MASSELFRDYMALPPEERQKLDSDPSVGPMLRDFAALPVEEQTKLTTTIKAPPSPSSAAEVEAVYQRSTGRASDEGVLEPGMYPGKGLVGNLLTGLFDPGVLLDPSNLVGGAGAGAWTGRTAKAAGKGVLDMLTGGYGLIHGFGKGVAQGLKTRGMTPQPTTLPPELEMVIKGKAPAFYMPSKAEGTIPTVGEQALVGVNLQKLARQSGGKLGYFRDPKTGAEVLFNPDLVKTSQLKALAKKDKLSEVVNGPDTSPKPIAPTEAVVVRTPDGTEIRTILTDTPEKTAAAVKAQPPGTQVEVKPFDEVDGVLQERMAGAPEVTRKEVRLAGAVNSNGSLDLRFHRGKAPITADEVRSFFPTTPDMDVGVQAFQPNVMRKDLQMFRVTFYDKNGKISYQGAEDALASLGGKDIPMEGRLRPKPQPPAVETPRAQAEPEPPRLPLGEEPTLTDTPEKTAAAVKAQPPGTQVEVKPFDEVDGVLQERVLRNNVEDARTSIPKQVAAPEQLLKDSVRQQIEREKLSEFFFHGSDSSGADAIKRQGFIGPHKDRNLFLTTSQEEAAAYAKKNGGQVFMVRRADIPEDFVAASEGRLGGVGQHIEIPSSSPNIKIPIVRQAASQPKLFQTQVELQAARGLQGGAGRGSEELAAMGSRQQAVGGTFWTTQQLRPGHREAVTEVATEYLKRQGIVLEREPSYTAIVDGQRVKRLGQLKRPLIDQLVEVMHPDNVNLPALEEVAKGQGMTVEQFWANISDAAKESVSGGAKAMNWQMQMAKRLANQADQMPGNVRLRDMFFEAWLNGLVSGLPSQIANIVGNTLAKLTLTGERGIAAGLDVAVSKLTGTPRTRYFGEVKADVFGAIQGLKLGFPRALRAFREETTGLQKVEYQPAGPGRLGKFTRLPTRTLSMTDELAKSVSEQAELSVLAFRTAKGEGLRGDALTQRIADLTQNPPKEWAKQIIRYGEYATFNNPLGRLGSSLMEARNHHLLTKMIAPFIRTPANIAKFALARTPAGLAYTGHQILKGNLKGGEAIDALAAGIMGSLIGAGTVLLAAEGYITGGGPTNPQVKNLLRETGWQPYSLTDGKTYLPINRFEPVSSVMGMAADFVEMFDDKQPKKMIDVAAGISASISENLTNKTFLVGIENAFQAFTEPKRFFERWAKGMTGSAVPNIMGVAARAIDPTMRETSITTAPLAKIPFASKSLPAKQSVFGEEIVRPGTALERFTSPAVRSSLRSDREVEAEAARLGLALRPPRDEVSLGKGVKISRTTDEQRTFQRQSGQLAKQLLREAISWKGYMTLPDEIKRDFFTRIITKSRAAIKAQQMPSAAQPLLSPPDHTEEAR